MQLFTASMSRKQGFLGPQTRAEALLGGLFYYHAKLEMINILKQLKGVYFGVGSACLQPVYKPGHLSLGLFTSPQAVARV